MRKLRKGQFQHASRSNTIFREIFRCRLWVSVSGTDFVRWMNEWSTSCPVHVLFCYTCRHVILPADLTKLVPKSHLMTETEWRNLGVQQSPGWVHYMMHAPEPHVILFRRPRTDDDNAPTITTSQTTTTTNTSSDQTQNKTACNVSVKG